MPTKRQEIDVVERLKAKTIHVGNCWIWTGKAVKSAHGTGEYGYIWYKGKMLRIGRLVCHLFHSAVLEDQSWTANHKPECSSSLCWNPEHLYAGTQADNVRDSIEAGTFNYGTKNLTGYINSKERARLARVEAMQGVKKDANDE